MEKKVEPIAKVQNLAVARYQDGRIVKGTTQGYTLEREGFFIVPLEEDSNNLRIFVISKAVKEVDTWK